jgi:hypothetical protein
MTLTSKRSLAQLGAAAALALMQAAPASAGEISIPFDADQFPTPPAINEITNVYWPLAVGDTFIYKAETPDGCEEDHVTVTSGTKLITIEGETLLARVVLDTAYEDEACDGVDDTEVVELTNDWYAQDDSGNIWYFGEETYDCNGLSDCDLGDGSWEAGLDIQATGSIAMPGIIMLDNPTSGDSYRQELYEGFAEDWGKIMGKNADVVLSRDDAMEPGEWDNCLATKEWNALESGHIEQKYYCVGAGLVAVDEHHGKIVRFELTDGDATATGADAFTFRTVPKN